MCLDQMIKDSIYCCISSVHFSLPYADRSILCSDGVFYLYFVVLFDTYSYRLKFLMLYVLYKHTVRRDVANLFITMKETM